tara:strand:+ start:1472 stop:1639 length:168 start_codon:yes stop_codon:yes gene_type:complete
MMAEGFMREPMYKLALNFTDADGNPGVIQTECAKNIVDQEWAKLVATAADLKKKE